MLEADYQKAGEAQRGYEQEHRILLVEMQDMKMKVARLEAENRELDSLNHALHQRIMFENAEGVWKEKYEILEKAYSALATTEKMRGDALKENPPATTKIVKEKTTQRLPPPLVARDKAYSDLKIAKEVKIKEDKPLTHNLPAETKTELNQKNKFTNNNAPVETKKETAPTQNKETITASGAPNDLNKKIETVLTPYNLGNDITQIQQEAQIILTLSDEFLFENGNHKKFSEKGEEVLHKLIYTFKQYPKLNIDLISEGSESDAKTKKIGELFSQYGIKVNVSDKNAVPLAYETTGTQKANSLFTVRMR